MGMESRPSTVSGVGSGVAAGWNNGKDPGSGNDLDLVNVEITYAARRGEEEFRAVGDVSFSVSHNEFACVVGPSGCGKSSILMAVAGLVPISSGRIVTAGGADVTGPSRERAVVFQAASLLPWRTVLGNAAYGLELAGRPDARERAMQMVKLVGLSGFESRYPNELSGGMQQRVNLARALTADPKLLLMDEPFAALDAQTRDLMQTELLRIWSEMKKTVMFVTHNIEEAVYLGDRVVVMSKGPASVVRKIVPVGFERPRDERIRRTPSFAEVVDHIWELIRTS